MDSQRLKQQAAAAALAKITPLLNSKSIVGVGTSTTNCFIDELASIKHTFDAAVSLVMLQPGA